MKNLGYMNRAMRSADPRYARILSKLGYKKPKKALEPAVNRHPVVSEERDAELDAARAEYEAVTGERPDMRWGAARLMTELQAYQSRRLTADEPDYYGTREMQVED